MPVTLTPDDQGVRVVGQAVQGSAGQQVIAEDLGPFFKGSVTGDDEGPGLVAVGNDVVQVLSGLRGERLQSEVIQDQQVHRQEFIKETNVSPTGPGGVPVGQQALGAAGEDPQFPFQGFDGQGVSDMTFNASIDMPPLGKTFSA